MTAKRQTSKTKSDKTADLTKRDLDHYRQVLKKVTARMQEDAREITELARESSGGQGMGELSNVPMHLGDRGTEEYLQDLNVTLLENEEYLVNESLAALQRLDAGNFGRCEHCGNAIPRERLDAIPYVRYCTGCAERGDQGPSINLNVGRPQTPADTLAPEGDMNEDRHRRKRPPVDDRDPVTPRAPRQEPGNVDAEGTPGGGTALGGLAGGVEGHGDPDVGNLHVAMSGNLDEEEGRDDDDRAPQSGRSGGAVGGTPAGKRARGGRAPKG